MIAVEDGSYGMKRIAIAVICMCLVPQVLSAAGSAESASSATRGRYLAGQGLIIPPEEIYVDSYIASLDYSYPEPEDDLGVYLYHSTNLMPAQGGEGILHIGIQGKHLDFDALEPLNLSIAIDISSSMNDEQKIDWVREALSILVQKLRDRDYLALVVFSDDARVLVPSTRVDSQEKRMAILEAIDSVIPQGGSNLEAGLEAAYEQTLANFRDEYTNRVIFFSDGTEFSSRLSRAGAQSGDVRVSLIWNNRNDLDLHVFTPGGEEIFYGSPDSTDGGFLDVDMNVGGETTKPVENVFWDTGLAPAGTYKIFVENFTFHEKDKSATPFQIEVKNGDEYSHFELEAPAFVSHAKVAVGEFVYKTQSAVKREKALIYQLAEAYNQMGINISTIGVGVEFDLELMRNLAIEGGGSSRFLSSREEMVKVFDTEFSRMAVPIARNVKMKLAFLTDVEILGTWGYDNAVTSNAASYYLPTLHLGDYETILVHYALPGPQREGSLDLAEFGLTYVNSKGNEQDVPMARQTVLISDSKRPVSGISDGVVLRSGSIMRFASALSEIGTAYYAAVDMRQESGDDEGTVHVKDFLEQALELARTTRNELENASLRLEEQDVFKNEIDILTNYLKTIGSDAGVDENALIALVENIEPDVESDIRPSIEQAHQLFSELILSLPESTDSTILVTGFAGPNGAKYPINEILTETAYSSLSGLPGIRVVERVSLEQIIEEQKLSLSGLVDTDSAIEIGHLLAAKYVLTGTVLPMSASVIIFGRLIDTETAEILNAAQVIVPLDGLETLVTPVE